MFKKFIPFCVLVCLPACLLADFSYEQNTKITGGMMAGLMKFAGAFSKQLREPMQSTIAVKGNRMVNWNKDHATVIDLDSETFTEINFQKKQYSVMTFAEMTQAMEQGLQQMKDNKTQEKTDEAKADFKVDIKQTGQTKQIAGYEAKEMIMTAEMESTDPQTGKKGGMLITSNVWIAPKVAGHDEIREFYQKMATKMAWTPSGSALMASRPDLARGLAGINKEAAKLDGVQLLQIVKMTPTAEGQPITASSGSEGQTAQAQQQSKPKPETPSLSGALAGRLGGFGGFGRKKKQEQPKEETKQETAQSTTPAGDAPATLMEMTTETSGFSSAPVDPSRFAVPSGFKKIEHEGFKRQR